MALPRDSPSISGICMSEIDDAEGIALGAGGAQHVERLRGALGLRVTHAPRRQLLGQDQAVRGVVVHDQDAHAAEVGRARPVSPVAAAAACRRRR